MPCQIFTILKVTVNMAKLNFSNIPFKKFFPFKNYRLFRFGEKFSEEEADEFFALIDVNKDGIINYEEFVKYMLSEINRGPPPRAVRT